MNINMDKSLNLITQTLQSWYELSIKNLPNIIVAILVILLFSLMARLLKSLSLKLGSKSGINRTVSELISKTIFIGVILTGIFIALGILQLDKTVTSLLAGAGVIGLALGFAFQEIASNFVSGIFIALKQPYSINDIVEADGLRGTVKSIDLRTTSLMTFQGIEILIPNKSMFTKPLKNYTTISLRRLDLNVGVSYEADLKSVKSIAEKALKEMSNLAKNKEIEVLINKFDSSSINFNARIWLNYKTEIDFLKAQDQAIIIIKESFDKNKISIPFPIRTLDISESSMQALGGLKASQK